MALELDDTRRVVDIRPTRNRLMFDSVLGAVLGGTSQIRRAPGFGFAVLANLTVGIGATVAVFSLVYGVLFRPLPFPNGDRIVRLSEEHPGASAAFSAVLSNLTFSAWADGTPRTLDALAGYRADDFLIRGGREPVLVRGADVSPGLFAVLGAKPMLGRFFLAREAHPPADHVLVLAHSFWRNQFRSDPHVIGRTVTVWGDPYTIVGVAPAGFAFPDPDIQLWTPFVMPTAVGAPGNPQVIVFDAVGLLKIGVTPAQAAAEGTGAARALAAVPGIDVAFGVGGAPVVRAVPFVAATTSAIRPALVLLSIGVGFLLLTVCANLVTLFLFHSASRRREIGIRVALGATVPQVVRQLLTESAVLLAIGSAMGMLLAWALVRGTVVTIPDRFPRLDAVRVDTPVLMFAIITSACVGLAATVWPAYRRARMDPADVLRGGDTANDRPSSRPRRTHAILLATESTFAALLVVTALLLTRSFLNAVRVDPGYSPTNALAATVYVPAGDGVASRRYQLLTTVLARLRALPGVVSAGAGNMAPLDNATTMGGFPVPADADAVASETRIAQARVYMVTDGYAQALGLRLVSGRLFADTDYRPGVRPWLVNEEFARQYLPDDPVRRRFIWLGKPLEIVGVVGNVLKDGYADVPKPEVYVPLSPTDEIDGAIRFIMRVNPRRADVAAAVPGIVRRLATDAAVKLEPLSARVNTSTARPRFTSRAMTAFALVAMTLSALGLYGALSYSVTCRRRELGIRAALGGSRLALVALVMRDGILPTAAGAALGLAIGAAVSDVLRSQLFEVTPLDFWAFAATPVALLIVAALASGVPAHRASSSDPLEALRQD